MLQILNKCAILALENFMDFIYVDRKKKITNSDIIEDLHRVRNEILKKDKITEREYLLYGQYGSRAIRNHFGTWNNLLSKANIELTKIYQHLSKEDIFSLIESLWIQLGEQPTLREFESITKHTSKIIISNFGTWSNCLQKFVDWENNKKNTTKAFNAKHKTQREPSKSLRYDVLTRDGYKCVICGRSPVTDSKIKLHVDHIIPYSLGGETTLDNLQTLCSDCNLGKSNKKD